MDTKIDTNVLLTGDKSSIEDKLQLPTDCNWGTDSVSLSVPVSLAASNASSNVWTKSSSIIDLESGKEYEGMTGYYETTHGSVRLSMKINRERCYLEFNSARIVNGKSLKLLQPNALKPLVRAILDELKDVVVASFDFDEYTGVYRTQPDWAKQVQIARIDLARNLYIQDNIPQVKKALQAAMPLYGKSKVTYDNPDGGWTLYNKTASTGVDRIYDKTIELASGNKEAQITSNEHVFRFEAQLQKGRIIRAGLSTLDSVTDEKVWQALEERWEACRWGVTVSEPGTLERALAGLDPKREKDVAGFLYMASKGTEGRLAKNYQSLMRKICRQIGVTPGIELYEQGLGIQYLDLFKGCLVEMATPLPQLF